MKKYIAILATAATLIGMSSCIKDLDIEPLDDDVVLPEDILTGIEQYEQVLAKCYVGLCTSGSWGAGSADIDGIDNGFGQYIRALYYLEELPTDEALIVWDDKTIANFWKFAWTSSDVFVRAMFSRVYFQISMCNELIRQAQASSFRDNATVKQYIAEARALRLLSYYHVVDMFGYEHVPFSTEANSVGSVGPAPNMDLVSWMISEADALLEGSELPAMRSAEYGRLDKGFVQMLKAKINLNAPVYLGLDSAAAAPYYQAAAEACKAIVSAYPTLHSNYAELFMADNDQCKDEIIFWVEAENGSIETYGSTQFLICATYEDGDSVTQGLLGMGTGGWGGIVVRPTFIEKFDAASDKRYTFSGGPKDFPSTLLDPGSFASGWSAYKFSNMKSDGTTNAGPFTDTDFPLFRSADAYLMLAECQLRGASNVTEAEAKAAWNAVRTRAGLGNVTNYTLDELLDERGRELYWECQRRSDLRRFGKFTGNAYSWTWKGGDYDGNVSVDSHFDVYPIPAAETNSNSALGQNPGYAN